MWRNAKVLVTGGAGFIGSRLVDRLQPDVVVVDLMMPGRSGLEVTRELAQRPAAAAFVADPTPRGIGWSDSRAAFVASR